MRGTHTASGLCLLALASGCYTGAQHPIGGQDIGIDPADASTGADGDGSGETGADAEDPPAPQLVGLSGMRRLTQREYADTVFDLTGVRPEGVDVALPTDDLLPFDNDYTTQAESASLVVGVEALAGEVATAVLADPALRSALVPCDVEGPIDADCFGAFARDFGRRALRRPITDDEVQRWGSWMLAEAEDAGRFSLALETVLGLFLQHPEFLYRIDRGEVVDEIEGVVRLDDWTIASKLSFLLWGVGPDDALLDVAAAGELSTPDQVHDAALRMLDDDRARARVERFHAMWMGYEVMAIGGDIGDAMRLETGSLISRVVFDEERPWQDIFRASETYVDDALAEHYGIEAPDDPAGGWVDYGESGRGGILSHGTFLSNGFKDGDTSPIVRGGVVSTMLLCLEVPEPPDNIPPPPDPTEGSCKIEEAAAHLVQPSCAGCHAMLDGLGFGLENYDEFGQFRAHDVGKPDCTIEGDGEAPGLGKFNGPAELGALMAESELVNACLATQAYRFAVGRTELDAVDEALIDRTMERLGEGDFRFKDLLIEQVSDPAFGFARRHTEND